jgi:metal-sulfur cluster biosynthetic enzyme
MSETDLNNQVDEEEVRQQLTHVIDPCSKANGGELNIIEMGLLKSIDIEDGNVTINMRLTTPTCMMIAAFVQQIEEHVGEVSGVKSISLETDDGLQWEPSMMDSNSEAVKRRENQVETINALSDEL